MKKPPESPD